MKILILSMFVFFIACEQDPSSSTGATKKVIKVVEAPSSYVDIFKLKEDAISNDLISKTNRLFLSVVENHHEYERIHRRAFIDIEHFIGSPEYYIDYGYSVKIEDIPITRDRSVRDGVIDYDFNYFYDSETMFGSYPTTFDFNSMHNISNINNENQTSSKRIYEFDTNLDVNKRIKFNNVVYEKFVDTNEDFEIELNRAINSVNNAFGFVFQPEGDEAISLTMKVTGKTNSFYIPKALLKNFKDKVGLNQFECYIWIAETRQLANKINTRSKANFKSHETPIVVNFIQSKKVLF